MKKENSEYSNFAADVFNNNKPNNDEKIKELVNYLNEKKQNQQLQNIQNINSLRDFNHRDFQLYKSDVNQVLSKNRKESAWYQGSTVPRKFDEKHHINQTPRDLSNYESQMNYSMDKYSGPGVYTYTNKNINLKLAPVKLGVPNKQSISKYYENQKDQLNSRENSRSNSPMSRNSKLSTIRSVGNIITYGKTQDQALSRNTSNESRHRIERKLELNPLDQKGLSFNDKYKLQEENRKYTKMILESKSNFNI